MTTKEEQFQLELQDIRKGYYQLYKENQYLTFLEQYHVHIQNLYDILCQYYQVDYKEFQKFIFLTKI